MHYVSTADGVRIAYGTAGKGRPLLRIPNPPFVDCQVQWRKNTFYDGLCRNRMVVTFDPRAQGCPTATSRTIHLRLVSSTCRQLSKVPGWRVTLNGTWFSGALAITYAVRFPDRVSHLILDDAFADCGAAMRSPQIRAFKELTGNWEEQTEMMAFSFAGVGGEDAKSYAEFMRASTSQQNMLAMMDAFEQVDVTDSLSATR